MCEIIKEECLKKIKNRFELVLIASKLARDISLNKTKLLVNETLDKPSIIALKEIEKGYKGENKQTE